MQVLVTQKIRVNRDLSPLKKGDVGKYEKILRFQGLQTLTILNMIFGVSGRIDRRVTVVTVTNFWWLNS